MQRKLVNIKKAICRTETSALGPKSKRDRTKNDNEENPEITSLLYFMSHYGFDIAEPTEGRLGDFVINSMPNDWDAKLKDAYTKAGWFLTRGLSDMGGEKVLLLKSKYSHLLMAINLSTSMMDILDLQ
jgi:hypothetical protein